MFRFRVSIHAAPQTDCSARTTQIEDRPYQALVLSDKQTVLPMAVGFEQVYDRLEGLPRMFVEPDGSFVWTLDEDAGRWQLDGCLYDRGDRLMYVDVSGCCPEHRFDQMLATFGWPAARLMFQLTQHAVFLGESEFRRFAQSGSDNDKIGVT